MAVEAICEDCMTFMETLDNEYLDMVITSPPYNLNVKYNQYKDNIKRENYLKWLDDVFAEIKMKLKPNGSFFLNVGSSSSDPWIHIDVANIARKYFVLQNNITWIKSISIKDITYGHFKPINSKRFINNLYENIYHFTKAGDIELNRKAIGVPYVYKSNIKRFNIGEDKRCRGNCWYIPYKTQTKDQKGHHPAIFPEQLVEWCIKLHGYNGDTIIYDPFLGTGTTLVAAKKLNVNAIGTDIDKYYIDYAKERLSKI